MLCYGWIRLWTVHLGSCGSLTSGLHYRKSEFLSILNMYTFRFVFPDGAVFMWWWLILLWWTDGLSFFVWDRNQSYLVCFLMRNLRLGFPSSKCPLFPGLSLQVRVSLWGIVRSPWCEVWMGTNVKTKWSVGCRVLDLVTAKSLVWVIFPKYLKSRSYFLSFH